MALASAGAGAFSTIPDGTPLSGNAASSSNSAPSQSHESPCAPGECIVCLDKAASHIVVPCGHQCLCSDCAIAIEGTKCPVCRQEVLHCMRVFACGWQASEPSSRGKSQKRKSEKKTKSDKKRKKHLKKRGEDEHEESGPTGSASRAAVDPGMSELMALKIALDGPDSSDNDVVQVLQRLSSSPPLQITEALLKETHLGVSVNSTSKNMTHSAATRAKAAALVHSWKELVLAERSNGRASSEGRAPSRTSSSQRGELEVLEVNMGRAAQRRIVRHATAARKTNITEALFVDECIDIDEGTSDDSAERHGNAPEHGN